MWRRLQLARMRVAAGAGDGGGGNVLECYGALELFSGEDGGVVIPANKDSDVARIQRHGEAPSRRRRGGGRIIDHRYRWREGGCWAVSKKVVLE